MIGNTLTFPSFAEFLIREGHLTKAQYQEALTQETRKDWRWELYVLRRQWVSEKDFAIRLGQHLNIPFCDLTNFHIPRGIGQIIPELLEKRNYLVSIKRVGKELTIGMFDPRNHAVIEEIQCLTGFHCSPVIVVLSDFEKVFDNLYFNGCFDPPLMEELDDIGLDPDEPPSEPPSIPTKLVKEIENLVSIYATKVPLDLRLVLNKTCILLNDGDIPLFRLTFCGPGKSWRFGLFKWDTGEYESHAVPFFPFRCSLEEGIKKGLAAFC
ncbi:MAG: hypothetical protein HQM09_06255 [Candidatus Riflebacteria bacterium]|nr:hypothetical protein [Candidatus Riflebacteria bacterium]